MIASMHFASALLDLNCCNHRVSAPHACEEECERRKREAGGMTGRGWTEGSSPRWWYGWPAAIHAAVSPAPDQVLAYQFRRHNTFLLPDRAPHHERHLGGGGGREAGSRAGARPPPWRSSPLHDGLRPALRRAAATPPWWRGGARAGRERRRRRARGGDGAEARIRELRESRHETKRA